MYKKNEIAFLEHRSDTTLYKIHSEGLENCQFHVFAILCNVRYIMHNILIKSV